MVFWQQSLRWFRRRDAGFTLTELAIAMAVLGVLASIAIPSFLGSRNNSYDKEAQASIEVVLRAASALYSSQGDFSDARSAGCGTDAGVGASLANDLQKLQPNVDVVGGSVASTSSRVASVDARSTFSSNGEKLGCQAFYVTVFSSSGTCFVARLTFEGKFLLASFISPIRIATQLNTQNVAVTTWSALAVNGVAYAQIRSRSSGADAENTQTLALIQSNCKAQTQSTGSATTAAYYADPSNFYQSWRDTTTNPAAPPAPTCAEGGPCILGDVGPGGGNVFYVQASGGTFTSTGSDCNTTCKYLEAAPSNVRNLVWGGSYSNTNSRNNTGEAIGTGYANTLNDGEGANGLAFNFSNNGKTDWHLPSKSELNEMCKWQYGITSAVDTQCSGGVTMGSGRGASSFISAECCYWSSTEASATSAWEQQFSSGNLAQGNGYTGVPNKTTQLTARFARAFG